MPDTDRNRAWLGKDAGAGYPRLELMTLVETGTRALVGAVFGPTSDGETSYASRLLHLLTPDMLLLWDRGFDSAYYALRHTILDGRVLRSDDPAGLRQEMWALLALYQAIRTVMVTAVESVPGTDPDRASFTAAMTTAQDLVATIGREVLANLLDDRRPRTSFKSQLMTASVTPRNS